MIKLACRYRFCASHRLHSVHLDEERNQEIYGKCNNPYGHGHNYVVEIAVRGPVDAATGQVIGRAELDGLMKREVLDRFDHKNMNLDLEEFRGLVPTTENLAAVLDRRLREAWGREHPGCAAQIEEIKIFETPRNIVRVQSHENT